MFFPLLLPFVLAAIHLVEGQSPVVTLDQGTFTGISSNGVNKFLGIPFGEST
jgi:hypothetical protein